MDRMIKENESLAITNKAISNEEYDEAYIFCNAALTKYLINIKRHTELLLKSNPKTGNLLLEIDLKALEEIFNKIGYIIHNVNILVNINDKFERIEKLFDNKRLFELIRFYRIVFMKIFNNHSEMVKELLEDFDFSEIEKVELLELYFEEIASYFEYSLKNEILSKIIETETVKVTKIKYTMILARNYFINGDIKYNIKFVNDVLDSIKDIDIKTLYDYELFIVAKTYFSCGLILEYNSFFDLSIDTHNKLLTKLKITKTESKKIADLYNEIGEVYLMKEQYNIALEKFKLSLKSEFNHLAHINLARANIGLDNIIESNIELNGFNIDSIPEDNLLDYLITMGRILIKNKDKNKAKEIYDSLKRLNIEEKLFDNYRNEIIVKLLEQYKGFYENTKSNSFKDIIEEINQSFELRPNIMGIGININNIISKFIRKK